MSEYPVGDLDTSPGRRFMPDTCSLPLKMPIFSISGAFPDEIPLIK